MEPAIKLCFSDIIYLPELTPTPIMVNRERKNVLYLFTKKQKR